MRRSFAHAALRRRFPARRAVSGTVMVVCAILAGCGGAAKLERAQLSRAILQPGDLPAAFRQVEVGRQTPFDAPPGDRADPARFGRIDGWQARFARHGTPATPGPLVVEARVDAFGDADGARRELAAIVRGVAARDERAGAPRRLTGAPRIGEEAVAFAMVQPGSPADVRHFTVAWRHGNAVGYLTINGFEGRVALRDAVRLAGAQQERMKAAAG